MTEMGFDSIRVAEEAINAVGKAIKELKHLNIVVIGKSGVGKSTLINSIFRDNQAETGIGKPVTTKFKKIEKEGSPLTIWDTPGFELGNDEQKTVMDELLELIVEGNKATNVNDAIHCIWYCINTASHRIEPKEIEWIRKFTNENKRTKVPVIVILTQACPKKDAQEMKIEIEKENLDIIKVIPVLAQSKDFDGEFEYPAYGLDTLIEVMGQVLPNELQKTLQYVQIASLKVKKKQAQMVVATTVAAAIGESTVPIPLADAAMLIPTQIAMITSITIIFGLDISKSFLTGFVSSTLGAAGATVLGKTAVTAILKCIPGVGTVIGGAISGATAGIITTALGMAYIKIMEMIYKGEMKAEDLNSDKGRDEMSRIFKEELKKKGKIEND